MLTLSIFTVHRWFPGVLEEYVEETTEEGGILRTSVTRNIKESVFKEAEKSLEAKKLHHMNLTKDVETAIPASSTTPSEFTFDARASAPAFQQRGSGRRRRVRTSSTPVIGGDLFSPRILEDAPQADPVLPGISEKASTVTFAAETPEPNIRRRLIKTKSTPGKFFFVYYYFTSASFTYFVFPKQYIIAIESFIFTAHGKGGMFSQRYSMNTDASAPFADQNKVKIATSFTDAELIVHGQTYNISLAPTALNRIILSAKAREEADRRRSDNEINASLTNITNKDIRSRRERQMSFDNMLEGFVRKIG